MNAPDTSTTRPTGSNNPVVHRDTRERADSEGCLMRKDTVTERRKLLVCSEPMTHISNPTLSKPHQPFHEDR